MENLKTISVEDFGQSYLKDDIFVIDVRTQEEYAECHVKGARLYPLGGFVVQDILSAAGSCDGPIYILCKAGGRARKAAELIAPQTQREVCVVAGGTDACIDLGFPRGI